MVSHLSKCRKLIRALKPAFTLVDVPDSGGVIGDTELIRALAWGDYLRRHASRLYSAAVVPETTKAVSLLKKIRARVLSAHRLIYPAPKRSKMLGPIEEHMDGENGLLLAPSRDHLFDHGFNEFDDNGQNIASPLSCFPSKIIGSHEPRLSASSECRLISQRPMQISRVSSRKAADVHNLGACIINTCFASGKRPRSCETPFARLTKKDCY